MIDLYAYGYRETEPLPTGLIPGRVTELRRERYTLMTAHGETAATLKGKFYYDNQERADYPCVGDFVLLEYNAAGDSRIARLLPRHSKFSRADFSGHAVGYAKTILEQVVAANFDFVFILSSLNHDFSISRIQRYLTQARQSGAQPVVVLAKADLAIEPETAMADVLAVAPDIPVHAISSYTGYGLSALERYLQPGKTIVFLGMSGVGKSSLLNTLMHEKVMEVRSIREDDSRGHHTTTHRQLFLLPSGAMVIDTPGMRELGLFDAQDGIASGFADVEALFVQCRFNDCSHQSEPGCAVTAALENGTLARERWESYLAQQRENRFVDSKAAYLAQRRAKGKAIALQTKAIQKNGRMK